MKILINDLVIKEKLCNMNCDYCITKTNTLKKNDFFCKKYEYFEGSELQKNVDMVTNRLYERFKPAILKVSGGEILLVKGIVDYLTKHCRNYARVQLLTNGLLLSHETIDKLNDIRNINLQISLDHHTLAGNFYRTKDQKTLSTILNNIDYAISKGLPVEINCVLNDRNTYNICDFAKYLLNYGSSVLLLPFPVRGSNRELYFPQKWQLSGIEKLIDDYKIYKNILPPKIYLETLYEFLMFGKRKRRCFFSKVAIGSFDNGYITPCSNYWFSTFGSVLNDNSEDLFRKIETANIYNVLCSSQHQLNACLQCFTPWEIINLYLENMITIEELKKIHLYSFEGIETYLKQIKGGKK